jgi:quinolinate synthase
MDLLGRAADKVGGDVAHPLEAILHQSHQRGVGGGIAAPRAAEALVGNKGRGGAHENALVLSHPECEKEILDISDYIGSTADIIDYAKKSECTEFIICTEDGVNYKLTSDNPEKRFYFPNPRPCCKDMKLNTLESILSVLEKEDKVIEINEELRTKALIPLERMLELAK